VISAISCVYVVGTMDDGNCSPWVTCNSSVVQESIQWKGDLWWLSGGRPQARFMTGKDKYGCFMQMYVYFYSKHSKHRA